MSLKPSATLKQENVRLSNIFGRLKFIECKEAYKNQKTGEVTTKIVVFSEKDYEKYEVTVKGNQEEAMAKKPAYVDFPHGTLGARSVVQNGFQGKSESYIVWDLRSDDVEVVKNDKA